MMRVITGQPLAQHSGRPVALKVQPGRAGSRYILIVLLRSPVSCQLTISILCIAFKPLFQAGIVIYLMDTGLEATFLPLSKTLQTHCSRSVDGLSQGTSTSQDPN